MTLVHRLLRDNSAATAAEFAMVLPLLLLLLFGIIDAGRLMWEFNRAEKATQTGVRVAVVTNSIPTGIQGENYVGATVNGTTLTQGDVIPAGALGEVACTRTSCQCVTEPCPASLGSLNTTVFDTVLLPRMQSIKPDIDATNVQLRYTGSGVGFAGDPNGMEIAPMVTVQLTGIDFQPITSLMFATLQVPASASSLTAEDSSGSQSN